MLYRNSGVTILLRFFGTVFVVVGLFSMLGVMSICSFGPADLPAGLYRFVWLHTAQLLAASTLCTVFGTALSLYPARKVPMEEGQDYGLWQ
jgi:hypothetical protein